MKETTLKPSSAKRNDRLPTKEAMIKISKEDLFPEKTSKAREMALKIKARKYESVK